MKKEFEAEFSFIGDKKSFAEFVRNNIDQIAKECGWGEVKEIGKFQFGRKHENDLITLQVLHQNNIATRLFMQVNEDNIEQPTGDFRLDEELAEMGISLDEFQDLEGLPFSAVIAAFDDIIMLEDDLINEDLPTRFVVVSPVIDPRLVQKAREKDFPISFLMIDNDRCAYWKTSDDQQFRFYKE